MSKNKLFSRMAAGSVLLVFSNMAIAVVPDATVPEPGPMGLLVLGGVALLLTKRIKRNK